MNYREASCIWQQESKGCKRKYTYCDVLLFVNIDSLVIAYMSISLQLCVSK